MVRLDDQTVDGTDPPRVFTTDPDAPMEGRMFVWARMRWYERVEGITGAVEFALLPDEEDDLRARLTETESDLYEVTGDVADVVRDEFHETLLLYPESAELSDEPPMGTSSEHDLDPGQGS